jgi:hypothetical protein
VEKKNKILIMSLFVITAGVIASLIFLDFEKKPEVSTDIKGLYSSFTDYMKEYVDSPLKWLGCEPQQYSDDGSNICFLCEDADACFGYAWGNKGGGAIRVPSGFPYFENTAGLKLKFVDFCFEGLASKFGCQEKDGYNKLECQKVEFSVLKIGKKLTCNKIKILLRERVRLEDFAKDFCKIKEEEVKQGIEIEEISMSLLGDMAKENMDEIKNAFSSCGEYLIFLDKNKEITITKK